jgi:hypothetical protein
MSLLVTNDAKGTLTEPLDQLPENVLSGHVRQRNAEELPLLRKGVPSATEFCAVP